MLHIPRHTLSNSLRAAADQFSTDAAAADKANQPRLGEHFRRLDGPYATVGDVNAAISAESIPGRHPTYGERGFQPGCGCCVGPEHDRCTCHMHQDISRGLHARKCSLHREGL